jgi:hypothetical protein
MSVDRCAGNGEGGREVTAERGEGGERRATAPNSTDRRSNTPSAPIRVQECRSVRGERGGRERERERERGREGERERGREGERERGKAPAERGESGETDGGRRQAARRAASRRAA